ncbi:hypothetical protein ACJX0J_024274, partial [Zea mays]
MNNITFFSIAGTTCSFIASIRFILLNGNKPLTDSVLKLLKKKMSHQREQNPKKIVERGKEDLSVPHKKIFVSNFEAWPTCIFVVHMYRPIGTKG